MSLRPVCIPSPPPALRWLALSLVGMAALGACGSESDPAAPGDSKAVGSTMTSAGSSSAGSDGTSASTQVSTGTPTGVQTVGTTATIRSAITGSATTGSGTEGSSDTAGPTATSAGGQSVSTDGATNDASTTVATGAGGAGTATTGTNTTGGSDPDAAAHISACIDSLPWGQDNISDRAKVIDVILKTCQEFAPPGDWQGYCQIFLVAAINKESSYQSDLIVEDAYGGAADPTVGLTQIRFTSTVTDFAADGRRAALANIGCDFPASVSGNTAAPYMSMMQDEACNIGLGAWYYFIFGSGSGGGSPVWTYQYCQGQGVAGTLRLGMLSHLCGAGAATSGSCNDGGYVAQIKEWFDNPACNGASSGTHPFDLPLEPSTDRYCE